MIQHKIPRDCRNVVRAFTTCSLAIYPRVCQLFLFSIILKVLNKKSVPSTLINTDTLISLLCIHIHFPLFWLKMLHCMAMSANFFFKKKDTSDLICQSCYYIHIFIILLHVFDTNFSDVHGILNYMM